ncbi:MAG: glycosyltransferase family 4 protein [Acidimicrobiales bacterium]
MTNRLALAVLAASHPMGQQVYERELLLRAPDALGPEWQVEPIVARSLRASVPGTVRVPSALLGAASPALRRSVGHVIYRGRDLVHRLDLRLPPAPGGEFLTIHDVVPWRFVDERVACSDAAESARRAAVVVCPSHFSAAEVTSEFGVKEPLVIPYGVGEAFLSAVPLDGHALDELGIHAPFVLHAGGCTERKNLSGLAGAWPLVRSVHRTTSLVLLGPADPRRDRLFRTQQGAVLTGRIPDELIAGVMAAASCVVVPSLYEGFGLPAVEAMAVGVPLVAANRSSLPEVCGDAGLLVEPSARGLAEGIIAVLDGGSLAETLTERGRQRARTLTWDASVRAHAELWRSAVP